jgi:hypothetical protein
MQNICSTSREFTQWTSVKNLILSKKRGLNTLLNQKLASSRELMISRGMLSRDSVKCKQFGALQSEYPKGHVFRRLRWILSKLFSQFCLSLKGSEVCRFRQFGAVMSINLFKSNQSGAITSRFCKSLKDQSVRGKVTSRLVMRQATSRAREVILSRGQLIRSTTPRVWRHWGILDVMSSVRSSRS